jgi:spermidine/putrescine-binding protein
MNRRSNRRRWAAPGALLMAVAILFAACSGSSSTPAASGAAGLVQQGMTKDQIAAAIKAEGSLVVGNWTYSANAELEKQFKAYVKTTYGVDINFTYEGSQQPHDYLVKIFAAQKAGNPSPYDVAAIEENYWAEAKANNAVADYLPSDLIPNQKLVIDQFQHAPTAIAFQATAFPAVVYNKTKAPFQPKLMDLADPRLKGRITAPAYGDITAGGFFLGLASELGKDYKDPAQMKEVVDWFVANIAPNVVKYSTDQPTLQQLFETGAVDAFAFWNATARLEYLGGHTEAALLQPSAIYPVNGYMWIPKGAPHPVLAETFINWRLSPEVQFPNAWPIDHGPWSELSEGYLGPSYTSLVPDWFKANYSTYYPSLDDIKSKFKSLDWDAYNAGQKEWQDYYAQKTGQ